MKKLRAVIGAVTCQRSHANTRSGHDAAQDQAGAEREHEAIHRDDVGLPKRDAV